MLALMLTAPLGTAMMENFPLSSVEAPRWVPTTRMLTNGIGSPLWASVTVPTIFPVFPACPITARRKARHAVVNDRRATCNLDVINQSPSKRSRVQLPDVVHRRSHRLGGARGIHVIERKSEIHDAIGNTDVSHSDRSSLIGQEIIRRVIPIDDLSKPVGPSRPEEGQARARGCGVDPADVDGDIGVPFVAARPDEICPCEIGEAGLHMTDILHKILAPVQREGKRPRSDDEFPPDITIIPQNLLAAAADAVSGARGVKVVEHILKKHDGTVLPQLSAARENVDSRPGVIYHVENIVLAALPERIEHGRIIGIDLCDGRPGHRSGIGPLVAIIQDQNPLLVSGTAKNRIKGVKLGSRINRIESRRIVVSVKRRMDVVSERIDAPEFVPSPHIERMRSLIFVREIRSRDAGGRRRAEGRPGDVILGPLVLVDHPGIVDRPAVRIESLECECRSCERIRYLIENQYRIGGRTGDLRSEEHTSELQSHSFISY